MPKIFVDADGCPVKEEIYRVAQRWGWKVVLVANGWVKAPPEPWIESILVKHQFDAADNWIVEHVNEADIVITSDIPLAARCIAKNAYVLNSYGHVFKETQIQEALCNREISAFLRDMGLPVSGPSALEKKDRSRFLQKLHEIIANIQRKLDSPVSHDRDNPEEK